jgi:hypothetical protein
LSFVIAPLSLSAQIPNYVPTSGLVGWWPFNGNANDESGNGNNGTVNGATLTTDRFGVANKAYSFNGLTNTITIGNSAAFNFTNGQTISFWFNISSFPGSNESIVFSQQTSSSTSAIGFNVSITAGGNLNYRIGNGSSTTFAGCVNNSVNLNQWYHVICQIQNGQISVYLNAQITCANNQPNAIVGSPGIPMIIGDDTWGAGNNAPNYNGKLDDIAIYNRALTQQEIINLYTNSLPVSCLPSYVPTNGLVGYWPFCGNANDESGNGNNGTVNGAILTTDRFGVANKAYSFDGVNDYVSVNHANSFNLSSYTISIWVQKLGNGPNNKAHWSIISKDNTAELWNNPFHLTQTASGSLLTVLGGCTNNEINQYSGSILNLNQWNNITFSFDDNLNVFKTFVNGNMLNIDTVQFSLCNSTSPIIFGNWTPYSNFFNGKIDDIAIYNRALTQQEITNLYTNSAPPNITTK